MAQGTIGESQITSTTGNGPALAFVPTHLSPNPPFQMDGTLNRALTKAMLVPCRLDGISSLLPDLDGFLNAYVCEEVVPSSQIDGRQSSLSDLILYETEETHGSPIDDVMEVFKHTEVIKEGLVSLEARTFKIYNLKNKE